MSSLPDIRRIVASGLGTGYLPVAPGTWGSLVIVGAYLLMTCLIGTGPIALNVALGAIAIGASCACVLLGPFCQGAFGGTDPRQCTLDEWAGQAISLIMLPVGAAPAQYLVIAVVGFLSFRIFDVVKPPPARHVEKLVAGWGILADDLVAGVYANAAAQLILRYWLMR